MATESESPNPPQTGGSETSSQVQGRGAPAAGWYPDANQPGQERYWDGTQWTDQVQPGGAVAATTGVSTTRISSEERKAILARELQAAAVRGLRVESQSEYQAALIEGSPVNHTLHAILTIFTCLIWGIVWAILAGTGGESRHLMLVDEYGNVHHQQLGKAKK
jgi:hypothetical protein